MLQITMGLFWQLGGRELSISTYISPTGMADRGHKLGWGVLDCSWFTPKFSSFQALRNQEWIKNSVNKYFGALITHQDTWIHKSWSGGVGMQRETSLSGDHLEGEEDGGTEERSNCLYVDSGKHALCVRRVSRERHRAEKTIIWKEQEVGPGRG